MGQASSAQREPSMEEILASIRRIIEDSETTRHPSADAAPTHEAVAANSDGRAEIDAFKAGLDEPVAPAADPVLATAEPLPVRDEADALPDADTPLHTAEIRPMRVESPAAAQSDPVELAAVMPELSADELVPDSVDFAPAPAEDATPAIISDHAGRQVAAAFGELSEAFAASRRRSFDEMAREMLRPMLQEWLDNNLPTLVEKLVREEIERVARGS